MSMPKKATKKRTRRAREKDAKKAAPGGTSGPVDRDVDESPDAVEARREAQSGPGATGVPHTGAGAADHPRASDAASDTVDDETALRQLAANDNEHDRERNDHDVDEAKLADLEDPPVLREPEHDKIDPHTRHER